MKKQIKSFVVLAGTIIALLAMTIGAAAAAGASRLVSVAQHTPRAEAPLAACTALEASEIYWITLDEDGEVDETVESYPEETSLIAGAYDYECVPRKTALSIVWSLEGEQILTDTYDPKASEKGGTDWFSLFMRDESPLELGEYTLEVFNGEDLLTSGAVVIGEGEDPVDGAAVTVQGTVVDSKSKKPITGALVIVLNEGVSPAAWLKDGVDEDVLAFGKTDSKGQFTLNAKVPVVTELPWIIGAKGYKTVSQDDFAIEEDAEDPFIMNIGLAKSK